MGLSNEGLLLVVIATWLPLVLAHVLVVTRGMRIVISAELSEPSKNLVALVAFLLVVFMYAVACTITMYAAYHDRETSPRTDVVLAAEVIWLYSPFIATLSVICINKKSIYPRCLSLIPLKKSEWILCAKRAFLFGVPLCFIFAAGDQILRQILSLAVTGNPSEPVPINNSFLDSVGQVFGYNGSNGWISGLVGFASNLTFGPFVNLFAPETESLVSHNNSANTGVGLYFLYAIPEEIGWTGTLYPLLINHLAPSYSKLHTVLMAISITGLVWGLWHCPFILLKWNPTIDILSGFAYNALFLVSCIATRCILTSLVWPVYINEPATHLLDVPHDRDASSIRYPSLFPAIFAHAALNCWWSFYTMLFNWSSAPIWSILTGTEYSLLATAWQTAIALLIIRQTFTNQDSSGSGNT